MNFPKLDSNDVAKSSNLSTIMLDRQPFSTITFMSSSVGVASPALSFLWEDIASVNLSLNYYLAMIVKQHMRTRAYNLLTDMQSAIKVCVTGAAGNIAYAFIPLLLTGQVFGDRQVDLRLLDIPQCEEVLKGVIMEIEDGGYTRLARVWSGSDPLLAFKDVDVIVFLGGFPRKPGMERRDLLHKNKEIFMTQGKALEVASPDVRCVVVANPANTNAYILNHFSGGKVKKENITCLSRLDHNRAISQITKQTGAAVKDISGIVIFGNHSLTQYPSVHTIKIAGKNAYDTVDKTWLQTKFIEGVQKRGGEVMNARKNSSVFSAANAVKDHLYDWYHGTEGYVSMGVYSEGDYGVPTGLWTSLPVICKSFTYTIVKDVIVTQFCKGKIQVTAKELQDEIAELEIA